MRTPLQLAWLIILVTRAHLVASTCAPVLIFASTIIYIFVRFICLSTAYVHIFTHKDPIFLQVDISNCLLAQLRLGLLRHPFFSLSLDRLPTICCAKHGFSGGFEQNPSEK